MPDVARRTILALTAGVLTMAADKTKAEAKTAWDFSFPGIDGGTLDFASFKGRVLLVVNTASFCGYTYQYDGLEKLHEAKSAAGLTVIGVPSQDFDQESAENNTVKTFCDTRFGIEFSIAAISHVRGPKATPFYTWVNAEKNWQPSWNFNKVLIARDGSILGTFGSGEEPGGPAMTAAIDAALAHTV
jgi:glutathione peroxidase